MIFYVTNCKNYTKYSKVHGIAAVIQRVTI